MIKVYIASPYSKGNQAENVRASMDAFDELAKMGFAPFSPLLSHFQHLVHPLPYDIWLSLDLEWLRVCDCVLRLPGESGGADKEETEAKRIGIPVFHLAAVYKDFRDILAMSDFVAWAQGKKERGA